MNVAERNDQAQEMENIYSNAVAVVVGSEKLCRSTMLTLSHGECMIESSTNLSNTRPGVSARWLR